MDILFRREQSTSRLKRVRFKLWAKVDLDENELEIIDRYGFRSAVLIWADQPSLVRNSIFVGIASAVLCAFGLAIVISTNPIYFVQLRVQLSFLPLIAGIFSGFVFFHQKRQTIYVRDLLHGRNFVCDSVIDLAKKEAWLGSVVGFLRQVMESAKHWDGTETIKVEALPKDEARAFILKG